MRVDAEVEADAVESKLTLELCVSSWNQSQSAQQVQLAGGWIQSINLDCAAQFNCYCVYCAVHRILACCSQFPKVLGSVE